ncbi:calmodulin-binding protein 60 D [Cajanus cajan]|uniref:calmodulin-binding protein 60 D n=1 Tax=Cajanus cajan TaxID=3821 RepID=UPI0010FB7927|nr:calmodulin-binding protein 60 D [Cajanus cajan]
MEAKRQYKQEGDGRDVQALVHDSKRRREDSQQSDTVCTSKSRRSLFHLEQHDIARYFENFSRRVVREELEHKLSLSCRPTVNHIGTSGTEFLQLVFENELPDTIFTFSKIKAKDNIYVKIALYDTISQSIVADGPLSSIKIDICVLDSTKYKILRQREHKGKLLKGETVITLKNGVGYINNVVFTDNTCWTSNRRVVLGAKVVQSNLNDAINIRSGRSKPFVVKDNRGELNQKHYPPSLKDEIWRLKYISKTGKIYERLSSAGINTVEDLLQELETNPTSLQEKFGKISKKRWEEVIEHAKTCVIAEVTTDGQSYHSAEKNLNSAERDLVPVKAIGHDSVKTVTQATQYGALHKDLQHHAAFQIAQQEEISRQMDNWSTVGFVPQATIADGTTSCWTQPYI